MRTGTTVGKCHTSRSGVGELDGHAPDVGALDLLRAGEVQLGFLEEQDPVRKLVRGEARLEFGDIEGFDQVVIGTRGGALGLVGGLAVIGILTTLDGSPAAFVSEHALIVIFGGCAGATLIRFPLSTLLHGFPTGMR